MATPEDSGWFQQKLAAWVVISGMLVVGLCAVTAIIFAAPVKEAAVEAKNILALLLPVVGTWIGTVLAFYFGKENFEAGAREARRSAAQPLDSKAVEFAIAFDAIKPIKVKDDADAQALALDNIDLHLKTTTFARAPIITNERLPLYVVHRQPLDSFRVAQATLAGANALSTLTLADLLKDPIGQVVKDSVVCIPATATLAEAKAAMEARKGCQDVFLTSTGKADSAILGWLTNNEIQRAATP
ncbi:hypothetical protein OOZ63_25800 [Paucibacter sp. PLA-PC-4]|uniref:hypothetical protein n=1 Tax=Paucibacter sp. PLA-PC-4 TaxID=2993655 RepID=UPI00224B2DE0|nr:hypothetical protein [Paucibacter sp. PLA-PC-4]MCX2865246.1 hypothetical protein [Paucibacter sp. PLA-PC-4]